MRSRTGDNAGSQATHVIDQQQGICRQQATEESAASPLQLTARNAPVSTRLIRVVLVALDASLHSAGDEAMLGRLSPAAPTISIRLGEHACATCWLKHRVERKRSPCLLFIYV